MKKILLTALLLTQVAKADYVALGELNGKIKAPDLAGTYESPEGDKVIIDVIEESGQQLELFKKEYSLYAELWLSKYDFSHSIQTSHADTEKDQSITLESRAECEDPGCEEYQFYLNIQKDNGGKMNLLLRADYAKLIDDEGVFESQEEANARCEEWLNPKKLNNNLETTLNDDGSIWCMFSEEISLEKK